MIRLSGPEARRLALRAQGFTDPAATGRVDARHVRRVLGRVGLLQIDSVNVLVRAHYLPVFSRLGPYPTALLDRMAYGRAELFEYWAHEQSLLPVALHPLVRWRMARAAAGQTWGGLARFAREHPAYVEAIHAEVVERGALPASALRDPGRRSGPWWGWGEGKRALEWLHWTGRLAAVRRPSFERVYDVPERVLPAEVLARPPVDEADARKALLVLAARALGVATAGDLADYHRQRLPAVRPLLAELVEEGALVPATVAGWNAPAFAHPDARVARRVDAAALVSPFDSLVWDRRRTERLFGFHLRLEIYTPAEKRRWGYYVLPFLLGDRLVGRVDLKADRRAGALLVHAAYAEEGTDPPAAAGPLAGRLLAMAEWLGLGEVRAADRGDLAPSLRRALAGREPGAP
ncbi:MAG TPA: crosslink repair DNA glycosylase YcaQ family protein [Acidimicrobiales bacterium]|nr:crosslink repair DNA glycosylase YcaQ family protein [Acidimicrobiales bacterium]